MATAIFYVLVIVSILLPIGIVSFFVWDRLLRKKTFYVMTHNNKTVSFGKKTENENGIEIFKKQYLIDKERCYLYKNKPLYFYMDNCPAPLLINMNPTEINDVKVDSKSLKDVLKYKLFNDLFSDMFSTKDIILTIMVAINLVCSIVVAGKVLGIVK